MVSGAHLPPGHRPGPQTRRRLRAKRWGLLMCGGFAAFFAVLGAYGAAHPGKSSAAVFYGVFGGLALLMIGLGALIALTGRPKRSRGFSVSAEPIELRRGGSVTAILDVRDGAAVAAGLEVGLVCTCYYDHAVVTSDGRGGTYRRRSVGSAVVHEGWNKVSGERREFILTAPADAPFSHEGEVLSFEWEVRARVPVRHRRDPVSAAPVWVAP